jgi:hypothetical protein
MDGERVGRGARAATGGDAMSDPTAPTFDDQLEALGFRVRTMSRRGGRRWDLPFNSLLTFMLHDYDDHVVLTWTLDAGRVLAGRGWQASVGDVDELEWFPRADVRLPLDIATVRTEITRVLLTLRLDLGDPAL